MNMADKKLMLALGNLVSRGELSHEDALKVEREFAKTTQEEVSRRGVLSEIGGYLGGLFIVIALLILLGHRWQNISRISKFSFVLAMALLLFIASILIGKSTGTRNRLAGVLGVASAICTTMAIIALRINGNGILTFGIFAGWVVTLGTFILYRTIIGEIGLAGFSIAVGISDVLLMLPHVRNNSYVVAVVLGLAGSIWLLLANKQFFDRRVGDALAMTMLFFSGQFMFNGEFRFMTYLIYIATAITASWLYSRSPEWPLLVGAIATITVGTGEFVGDTLGGSLGAALGLLTSGIFFVSGSVYSFKRSKRRES